jgi:hypothetical protein
VKTSNLTHGTSLQAQEGRQRLSKEKRKSKGEKKKLKVVSRRRINLLKLFFTL